jgi:hypothetical protein
VRQIIRDIMRLDIQTYRLLDFIRCGGRYYTGSWFLDSLRNSRLGQLTLFQGSAGLLRAVAMEFSSAYQSPYGPMATWHSDLTLPEFLDRFELKQSELEGSLR